MKPITSILSVCLLFISFSLSAQRVNQKVNSPRTYAANNELEYDFIAGVDATFPETNQDLLHAYIDPDVVLNENYLLKGNPIDGIMLEALPARFERIAKLPGTTTYAAAAIRGNGENLYVVRFAGPTGQQIDLFDVNGNKFDHVATLAYRDCKAAGCRQLDSYLVDVNMDGRNDIVQISRRITKNNTTRNAKQKVWLLTPEGKFKRSRIDVPQTLQNGLDFFNGSDYYDGRK